MTNALTANGETATDNYSKTNQSCLGTYDENRGKKGNKYLNAQ